MSGGVILGPGDGETLTDEPRRFLQIKAAPDQLATTESRYAPGESGPGVHIHRRHSDCFWVLDGRLVFELARATRVPAEAGTFVLVPPGLVHTFANEGPGDARFLNWHAPSMGFDDHLRALTRGDDDAAEERFDTFDPPADGGLSASAAVVRLPGGGDVLALGASTAVVKAGRDDGDGHITVMDTTIAPKFPGPVRHRHRAMADTFYVLEGVLRVEVEGAAHELRAGAFACAPPGTVHTFSNPGSQPVRFLNVMAPAGLEGYLRELSEAGAAPDPELMAQIASRYDFEPA
jgi:mannose-6-phosphate isomerase-like protein (cupin superfamily)